ncbi:hypothetical protein ILYODFUR_027385, partial [Ilyodon furcidens]
EPATSPSAPECCCPSETCEVWAVTYGAGLGHSTPSTAVCESGLFICDCGTVPNLPNTCLCENSGPNIGQVFLDCLTPKPSGMTLLNFSAQVINGPEEPSNPRCSRSHLVCLNKPLKLVWSHE